MTWSAPESLTSALSTALDSLANSTSDTTGFSGLSSEIDNEAGLYEFIELELNLAAQGSARSTGGFVAVLISAAVDATPNYPADSIAQLLEPLASFPLDAATNARRLTKTNIPIPPAKFKLYAWNKTGQAFASSGSTIKFRRYN